MTRRFLWSAVMVLVACSATTVLAADTSSADYRLRTEFIESRLEESRRHARYWQNGWTTFFAASAAAQAALWIDADNSDDSINYGIGALKSVGGLADILLRPHPGRYGAELVRSLPEGTSEQRLERLGYGEMVLEDSAARAASRHTWQPHLKVIGVNLVAGALVAAFGDEGDALASTALGIAIGEAQIWSQPTRYEEDWQAYQVVNSGCFGQDNVCLQLVPIVGGLALQGRF